MFFFPLFNPGEMILFATTAALLAYCFRVRPSWWVVFLFLPVVLCVLLTVVAWRGIGSLRESIGVGHVVSLVLIPLSTLAGAHYGSKLTGSGLKVQS
jgi:hypothetical protein